MNPLTQGLVLMAVGMVVVFCFLILLVFAMQASAAFFKKFAHLFPEEVQEASKPAAADPVAEIAVALAAIRAKRG